MNTTAVSESKQYHITHHRYLIAPKYNIFGLQHQGLLGSKLPAFLLDIEVRI